MFIIEEDAIIIPSPSESTHTKNEEDTKKYIKASIENQGDFMFEIKFTEEIKSKNSKRC